MARYAMDRAEAEPGPSMHMLHGSHDQTTLPYMEENSWLQHVQVASAEDGIGRDSGLRAS